MERATEFIQLYNQLSSRLSELAGGDRGIPFTTLADRVARGNSAVRAFLSELKDFAALRNAIVHNNGFPVRVIAEPSEGALTEFKDIVNRILSPPKLIPRFQKVIRCFNEGDRISTALEYMAQHDYSQIVVKDGSHLIRVLTAEGIARWLAQNAHAELVDIHNTTIKHVVLLEPPQAFELISRERTIYDASQVFSTALERRKERIFAIVITHSGKQKEEPLGIVTPWDVIRDLEFQKS
jgi:predicted transcriptional regulator